MSETSIKISLELADKAAQKALSDFISKGAGAEKALDKIKDSGKSTFEEITIGIGKSIGIFEIFAGNLAANLAIKSFELLAGAASSLFQTFIVDGVKAAQDAEVALNSLNVALAQSGIYSKSTSAEFQAFATQLQRTTAFEDDVILKNAALIQSLGQLDKDGLKRATLAALNLAAGLDKDVGSASEALGKAANGNVTALQKMGIQFTKGNTDAETFANALAAIEAKVGNAAAAKVNTYTGAVTQAAHSFQDITEAIGNYIVKNPVLINTIKAVTGMFNRWTDATNSQNDALSALVGGGVSLFLTSSYVLIKTLDLTVRVFETVLGVLKLIPMLLIPILYPLSALINGFEFANKAVSDTTDDMLNSLLAFGDRGDGVLNGLADDISRVKDESVNAKKPVEEIGGAIGSIGRNLLGLQTAAKVGAGETFNSITGLIEPLNQARAATQKLSEEQQRAQERLKSFAMDLVKQGESAKVQAEIELQLARAKADNELTVEQALYDNKLITQSEFLTRKAAIEAEFEALRVETELQKYSDDNARLAEALKTEAITREEYNKGKSALDQRYEADKAKLEAASKQRKQRTDKEIRDAEQKQFEGRMSMAASFFGSLGALAATGGKRMFEISKAFNLAEAVTAGVLAVQKAAASAPPPFNIIPIVTATAFSAANVIRIASTKAPSFQDGGIVPGSSFSGDKVSANVNSGEMILNRSQQKRLFTIANGAGGDSSKMESLLAQLLGAIESQAIIVNIGGRTIVDTIRSELAGGRTFA